MSNWPNAGKTFISNVVLAQEYRLRELGFKVGICHMESLYVHSLLERCAKSELLYCKRKTLSKVLNVFNFELYEAEGKF
jgi:hypothetical protein